MRIHSLLSALVCGTLVACTQQPAKDPLQNTKKLAAEGHATLYNNGAFEVPMTTIHIIPPGPSTLGLASEMAGMRARQSFKESIKHARESKDFAQAGMDKSEAAARAVKHGSDDISKYARDVTRFGGRMLGVSPGIAGDMIGASVTYSGQTYTKTSQAGEKLAEGSLTAGSKISSGTTNISEKMLGGTVALATGTSQASRAASGKHASYAAERFVKGYAALPEKLGQRAEKVSESASLDKFADAYRRSNDWRSEQSGNMTDIVIGTGANYTNDIKGSFSAAGKELESRNTFGLLKSMRWVIQGIFWDATIKPVGKLAGASLGYVTVNAVAFPAIITIREGVAVANVAVQVTWNSAASVYEVTAPSATAALAGLFSAVELVGGQALAGGELVAGSVATAGTYGVGKTAAAATAGGGYLTGKTVQYVGAPLSSVGVAAGGTALGVVAGATTAAAGTGLATAGAAGEAATRVTGNLAAGTVLVGGSAASVVAGTALGTYELAKAVVVPAGYELGSGLVLSYGTLSQLSAQTVLAVADASYMVLSLEGPNWVLYAVKGNVDNGENLPAGALLDLKGMQQSGETMVAVPVSEEEMKRIVNTIPSHLATSSPKDNLSSPP
ncbi:MAG TPA: hypothetical protein VGD24_06055 [Gallionella sp.]